MIVYLGADHRGFRLKETLKTALKRAGHRVVDMTSSVSRLDDDYPDIAASVAGIVAVMPKKRRGILVCESGVGMDVVANKFPGIRCALGISVPQIRSARRDDDVNILAIAAEFTPKATAYAMTKIFLTQEFSKIPRYTRRIKKIAALERSLRS